MFSIQMALMLLVGVLTIIFIISFIVLIIALIQQKRNRRRHAAKRKKSLNRRKKMKDISSENQEGIFEIKEDAVPIKELQNSHGTTQEEISQEKQEIEIDVQNVTMEFKREKDEATSIKELLIRTLKRQRSFEMFKALDNVSFTVYKGEVVGIIGTNGSGKSTILKIISGVLSPTEGHVEVDKNKIQLLTLGTGFDFELTGRENVYLNGAIIGYTKEYIDEKYDDIVKFAELEGFMEEKVRNYSSGMVSRLGFAIATVRDTPEILILDEVLSVGDMFFRQKSEARIKEMMHGGSTVLIVSHSTSVFGIIVQKQCGLKKDISVL